MPSLPPFARREQIATYRRACGRVEWREERIVARDGVRLGVGIGEVRAEAGVAGEGERAGERKGGRRRRRRRVVVVYFQGLVDLFLRFFFFSGSFLSFLCFAWGFD